MSRLMLYEVSVVCCLMKLIRSSFRCCCTYVICPVNFAIIEVSHQQLVRCSVLSYLNHKSVELSVVLLVAARTAV